MRRLQRGAIGGIGAERPRGIALGHARAHVAHLYLHGAQTQEGEDLEPVVADRQPSSRARRRVREGVAHSPRAAAAGQGCRAPGRPTTRPPPPRRRRARGRRTPARPRDRPRSPAPGQAALRIGPDVGEVAVVGQPQRLAALGDGRRGRAAGEAAEHARPVGPLRAPAGIARPLHELADGRQRRHVLGVQVEGELHLRLFHHRVDATQTVVSKSGMSTRRSSAPSKCVSASTCASGAGPSPRRGCRSRPPWRRPRCARSDTRAVGHLAVRPA